MEKVMLPLGWLSDAIGNMEKKSLLLLPEQET